MFDNIFNKRTGRRHLLRGIGNADATGASQAYVDYSALVDCTTLTLTGASISRWKLPPAVNTLLCSEWGLGMLPALPNSVTTLYCDNGSLTSLPTLPPGLSVLVCAGNGLGNIPNIPASLTSLDCHSCGWSSGQVNALLAGVVAAGGQDGNLDCSGSNSAPDGQGVTDAETLVARGWTVTTS